MIDEIRTLLARHLPDYEVRSIARLGEGLDNAAYEVNGEFIVRASKEDHPARRAESIRREVALLAAVAELSTLPVPELVFVEPGAGVLTYFKLPGVPLIDRSVSEPARPATDLGELLGCLHQTPLGKVESLLEWDLYPLAAWREDAERDYRETAEQLSAPYRRPVEGFLECTSPAEPRALAFCYNDLGVEHVLVNTATSVITGIIDWTDAAISDPARDFAPIYRDLGPEVFELTVAHYGGHFDDADRERATFYARYKLLEDVAYGLSTSGARRYAEAYLAHLDRTFT